MTYDNHMWNITYFTTAGDTVDPRMRLDEMRLQWGTAEVCAKGEGQGDNMKCQRMTLLSREFQGLWNPPILCHIQYLGMVLGDNSIPLNQERCLGQILLSL